MSKPTLNNSQPNTLVKELFFAPPLSVKRFSRNSQRAQSIVYEFTDDQTLLHQYYRIREMMYRKVHNTDKFVGTQDWHDKIGHTLIARRGRLCIGGCRLIVRDSDEDFLLPMENNDFKLRNAFPHLPLDKIRHAEVSRFAVLDDDDDHPQIMVKLSRLIVEKCVTSGSGYLFVKCPGIVMARNWRKIINTHCGQKDITICNDVKIPDDPDYPEIQWLIIKAVLPAAKTISEINS